MNKVKVRCSVCGKSFKTPSLKKTVCPNCEADMKRAKHQAAAPATPRPAVTTSSVDVRAALRAAQENQGQFGAYRAPAAPVVEKPAALAAPAARPAAGTLSARSPQPAPSAEKAGQLNRAAKPRKPRSPAPRPPRERKPRAQVTPFEPSEEQVAAIRQRYLDLAQPEFDGIRHRIATELGIPLRAVKEIVKQVRAEQEIPSWWDNNGKLPTPEEIEQIRALYLPHLPEPEIGVHKQIAAALKLSNTSVYQAIGAIRAELDLPRYVPRAAEEQPPEQSNGHDAGAVREEEPLVETATGE